MIWTIELATYLDDAPWPATKEELIGLRDAHRCSESIIQNLKSLRIRMNLTKVLRKLVRYQTDEDYFFEDEKSIRTTNSFLSSGYHGLFVLNKAQHFSCWFFYCWFLMKYSVITILLSIFCFIPAAAQLAHRNMRSPASFLRKRKHWRRSTSQCHDTHETPW